MVGVTSLLFTAKIATITIFLSAVVTVIFYFVLKALGTTNLGISTLSITTNMMACSLTIFRVPYYALAYAANDIYGFVSWKKIRARQES